MGVNSVDGVFISHTEVIVDSDPLLLSPYRKLLYSDTHDTVLLQDNCNSIRCIYNKQDKILSICLYSEQNEGSLQNYCN